jgi:hypothetical protein
MGRLVLQLIPLQLQKLSESSRHDRRTLCGSAEMLDLKQRRACRSASELLVVCAAEKVALLQDRKMSTPCRRNRKQLGDGGLDSGSMFLGVFSNPCVCETEEDKLH